MTTATTRSMLTPPQVAKRLAIDPAKVLAWIKSGELVGVDVSTRAGVGRPRFRVNPADLEAFLARRTAPAVPKSSRRRRRQPQGVTEYF